MILFKYSRKNNIIDKNLGIESYKYYNGYKISIVYIYTNTHISMSVRK